MLQLPSRPGGFIEPRRSPRAAALAARKKARDKGRGQCVSVLITPGATLKVIRLMVR